MQESLTSEQSRNIVTSLHNILKPFLLRRLKVDVEQNLPPKKEYVLYAPLTEQQKAVYEAVVNGTLRKFLINSKQRLQADEASERQKESERQKLLTEGRQLRKRGKKRNYDVDGNDEEYFRRAEAGEIDPPAQWINPKDDVPFSAGKEHIRRTAGKHWDKDADL